MPLVIFCAWHFCPLRPSWSSVGLLHRPLGYYIVRSPQLDERFVSNAAVSITTLLALCSALQSELEITLSEALR